MAPLNPEVRLERFLAGQDLTPAVRLEYFLAGAAGYGLAALQNESAAISPGGAAVANISDAAGSVPFQSIVTAIEPVQEGTGDPSPDNVRPISGHTGATLNVTGKNLVDDEYTTNASGGTSHITTDFAIPKEGATITASAHTEDGTVVNTGNCAINFKTSGNVQLFGISPTQTKTVPDLSTAAKVEIYTTNALANKKIYVQLEYGSTATEWTAYNGSQYTATFGQTVYGGTFDFVSGKLVVDMAMVDLGALTYTYVSLSGGRSEFIAKLDDIKPHGSTLVPINAISSMYKAVSYNASWVSGVMSYARDPNGGENLREVAFINNSYTDAEEFKTAMSGQTLVYELDNPIEIDLPDLTILANAGVNNIWSDTGNVLAVEYKQDPEASANEIKAMIAPVLPEMKADANLVANDFRIVGNTLYKITANIAAGGTLTPGSNCTATTIAAQLKALL